MIFPHLNRRENSGEELPTRPRFLGQPLQRRHVVPLLIALALIILVALVAYMLTTSHQFGLT
jgi:hypothetical protein